MRYQSIPEMIATRLLAREGIAIVWQLHIAAAKAHKCGNWLSAAALIGIADAAERMLSKARWGRD